MTNHIAEQLARRPEPSCGWQAHAQALEKELRWFRDQLRMVERHRREEPDVWYWQGNGEDHLETMVDELPVAIRAGQLRAMFAAYRSAEAPAQAQGEAVAFMWQHDETGRTGFVEAGFDRAHWEKHNPRLHIIGPLYRHPAQPAARMSEEQERAEFEAAEFEYPPVSVNDLDAIVVGGTIDPRLSAYFHECCWVGWKAARASLGVKKEGA